MGSIRSGRLDLGVTSGACISWVARAHTVRAAHSVSRALFRADLLATVFAREACIASAFPVVTFPVAGAPVRAQPSVTVQPTKFNGTSLADGAVALSCERIAGTVATAIRAIDSGRARVRRAISTTESWRAFARPVSAQTIAGAHGMHVVAGAGLHGTIRAVESLEASALALEANTLLAAVVRASPVATGFADPPLLALARTLFAHTVAVALLRARDRSTGRAIPTVFALALAHGALSVHARLPARWFPTILASPPLCAYALRGARAVRHSGKLARSVRCIALGGAVAEATVFSNPVVVARACIVLFLVALAVTTARVRALLDRAVLSLESWEALAFVSDAFSISCARVRARGVLARVSGPPVVALAHALFGAVSVVVALFWALLRRILFAALANESFLASANKSLFVARSVSTARVGALLRLARLAFPRGVALASAFFATSMEVAFERACLDRAVVSGPLGLAVTLTALALAVVRAVLRALLVVTAYTSPAGITGTLRFIEAHTMAVAVVRAVLDGAIVVLEAFIAFADAGMAATVVGARVGAGLHFAGLTLPTAVAEARSVLAHTVL